MSHVRSPGANTEMGYGVEDGPQGSVSVKETEAQDRTAGVTHFLQQRQTQEETPGGDTCCPHSLPCSASPPPHPCHQHSLLCSVSSRDSPSPDIVHVYVLRLSGTDAMAGLLSLLRAHCLSQSRCPISICSMIQQKHNRPPATAPSFTEESNWWAIAFQTGYSLG